MRFPWDAAQPLRVEVAFNSTGAAQWRDVSAAVKGSGVKVTRGPGRWRESSQPGQCSVAFDNTDGRFSEVVASVTRTNGAVNPVSDANTVATNVFGSRVTIVAAAGYLRGTVNDATASTNAQRFQNTNATSAMTPAAAGQSWTVSADVRSNTGVPTVVPTVLFFDGSGTLLTQTSGTAVSVDAAGAVWSRPSVTATAPASTAYVGWWFGLSNAGGQAAIGEWVDLRHVLVEQAATAGSYFDGDTTSSTSLYRWNGVAGSSTSQALTVPKTLYRKPLRVSYRTPGVAGNLLAAEDASFEGGTVGSWLPGGSVPPALTNSSVRAQSGTKSMLVTWGAGGAFPSAGMSLDTVIGRTYTFTAYVYVPVGHPAVQLVIGGGGFGALSTVTAAWQRISITWTATSATSVLQIWPGSAPTAGQQAWVDAMQVDEGSAPVTFTTTAPPISYRFTGRIATPRMTFPSLGRSVTTITATDELAWQGSMFRKFIDVPGQEILSRGAVSLFRLNGADLSDAASGGMPARFAGTGADPTDSGVAVSSASEAHGTTFGGGKYVTGSLAREVNGFYDVGSTLVATIRTTSTTPSVIASLNDQFSPRMILSLNAAGKVVASTKNPYYPVYEVSITSTNAVNDGQPHVVAARWDNTGVLSLAVDSAAVLTAVAFPGPQALSSLISIGGGQAGATFTGTIANVAAFGAPLSNAILLDIAAAHLSAFLGETAANRLARYNRWAGNPFTTIIATGATSQIGHYDTEGKGLTDCIDAVATVEDGPAHVNGAGALVLVARSSLYNQAPTFTIPGPAAGDSNRLRETLEYSVDPTLVINDITGTRPGSTQRIINSASAIDAGYGWRQTSVDGPFATDEDLSNHLEWVINTNATAPPIAEGLSVRMSQLSDADTALLLALDIGKAVAWSGLPTQAPEPSDGGIVLSLTETYSSGDLLWEAEAPPNPYGDVWVVGDPVYGQIGTTHRLAH